jgi:hypothetical protein
LKLNKDGEEEEKMGDHEMIDMSKGTQMIKIIEEIEKFGVNDKDDIKNESEK